MECSFLSMLPSQLPLPPHPLSGAGWTGRCLFPSKVFMFIESLSVASILQKSAAAFAVQNKISRINSFLFFFLSFAFFLLLLIQFKVTGL